MNKRCDKCKKLFEDRFVIRTKYFINHKIVCSNCYGEEKFGTAESYKCLVFPIEEYRNRCRKIKC